MEDTHFTELLKYAYVKEYERISDIISKLYYALTGVVVVIVGFIFLLYLIHMQVGVSCN